MIIGLMTPSYSSKAILCTACRKSLLHTVVNTIIYRLTKSKPVFSLQQQQQDELGIGLYGLSLWCSQSRRFTKPMCYFLSSVIFYVVFASSTPQYTYFPRPQHVGGVSRVTILKSLKMSTQTNFYFLGSPPSKNHPGGIVVGALF